jgi:hypothetical protein
MTPEVSSSLRRGGARGSADSKEPGIREELIKALAEALVADMDQCPTLPMPAPVTHDRAEANGARTPAGSGIMRSEPARDVGRPPRRPVRTGRTG